MSINARLHDFDGVFVDPLPPPRIVRGGAQAFPELRKSYTDQLEDDLDQERRRGKSLEAQIAKLQQRLDAAQKKLTEKRAPTASADALARAQRIIQRQHEKIGRLEAALETDPRQGPPCIRVGRLLINRSTRRVELDGKSFEPTVGEMLMLACLALRPDQVVDTYTLAATIGGSDGSARTYMWRLRPKMEAIGAGAYLRTKGKGGAWGGYWMTDPEQGGGS